MSKKADMFPTMESLQVGAQDFRDYYNRMLSVDQQQDPIDQEKMKQALHRKNEELTRVLDILVKRTMYMSEHLRGLWSLSSSADIHWQIRRRARLVIEDPHHATDEMRTLLSNAEKKHPIPSSLILWHSNSGSWESVFTVADILSRINEVMGTSIEITEKDRE